jgi:DNA-binding NarL/FixJ family response regulator
MNPLRILIADDHPLFRNGMRALLDTVPDMVVAGVAASGDEVISLAASLLPDVILMDLQMPGLGGIEATRRILAGQQQIGILIVTMFEDDHSVFTAMRAGARGYVLKDTDEGEMLRAIRAVGNGEAIFSPAIARRMVQFFAAPSPAVPERAFPELSDREREVLDLIARGTGNAEIATALSISAKTVRNHVSNIFSKLQVAGRSEAIVRARKAGLG